MDESRVDSVVIGEHRIIIDGEARFDLSLSEKTVHIWIGPIQDYATPRVVKHLVFADVFQIDMWLGNSPRLEYGDLLLSLDITDVTEEFEVRQHPQSQAIRRRRGPFAGSSVFTASRPLQVVLATASFTLEFVYVGEPSCEELTVEWPAHI